MLSQFNLTTQQFNEINKSSRDLWSHRKKNYREFLFIWSSSSLTLQFNDFHIMFKQRPNADVVEQKIEQKFTNLMRYKEKSRAPNKSTAHKYFRFFSIVLWAIFKQTELQSVPRVNWTSSLNLISHAFLLLHISQPKWQPGKHKEWLIFIRQRVLLICHVYGVCLNALRLPIYFMLLLMAI